MITGASRGIGRAIAERFFHDDDEFTDVVLLGRDSADFDTTVEKLLTDNPHGKRVRAYRVDLANRAELIDVLAAVVEDVGGIDLLVNNAAYNAPAPLHRVDMTDFERTVAVNLYAPFLIVQELLNRGNRFSLIVNIASTAGIDGRSGWLTYSASKAAVINMSDVMRHELGPSGTRVACVSPGRCATEMRRKLAPDEDPATIMQPDDVAAVVRTLASTTGEFIDSHNLVVRSRSGTI